MNTLSNRMKQSRNILAFDVSSEEASVAIHAFGKMKSVSMPMGTGSNSYAACLIPTIQKLMKSENVTFEDIDVIATPMGPGSFTGVRLGLATAQGLILATGARSFSPTTFHIAAFKEWCKKGGACLVTLTTKRDSFYTQGFDESLTPIGEAAILSEQEIQEFLEKHPTMMRVKNVSALGAEDLIGLYLYDLEESSNAKLDSVSDSSVHPQGDRLSAFRPYYLHNPEFVKTKKCSL